MKRRGLTLGLAFVTILATLALLACSESELSQAPQRFEITFETYCDGVIQPVWADEGKTIAAPDFSSLSKNGYQLVSWLTEGGGQFLFEETLVSSNLKLYAYWRAIDYDIEYNLDGGQNNPANPAAYTIEDEVNFLNPQKEAKTFDGWFTNNDFKKQITKIEQGTTGKIAVFAKWSNIVNVDITFDTQQAGEIFSQTLQQGQTVDPPQDPEKAGYLFMGWRYKDGSPFNFLAPILQSVTVYAEWEAIKYDIEFNLDGGDENHLNPVFYTIEDEVILKDAFKFGHTFLGWFDADNNKVERLQAGTMGKITLFARWSKTKYFIEYFMDGGTNHQDNPLEYTVDDAITLKDAFKNGYKFLGWFSLPDGGVKIEVVLQNSAGDIALYARWQIAQYKITYQTNGGFLSDTSPLFYTVESQISLPQPTKDGYKFEGWFTNAQLSGEAVTSISKGTTGDIDLYAKWQIAQYKITYQTNGGTNHLDNPIGYTADEEIVFKKPLRDGYTFCGWFISPALEQEIKNTSGYYQDLTLYAKWEIIDYKISYVLDGGVNSIQNPTNYTIEDEIILFDPSKSGYEFKGWYTDGGFNNKIEEIKNVSGDLTLYAKWEIINYKITYVLDGGANSIQNPASYTIEDEIILFDPTKTGYQFMGWYTDSGFSNKIEEIKNVSGDLTLYAKWKITGYTITYHLDGGTNSIQNPASYTEVNEVIFLSPVKTGYQFKGWFLSADLKQEIKNTSGYYQDLTLYAKWEIINYEISYVLDGGINSIQNPTNCTIEDEFTLFDPTKTGYQFMGWYTDTEFNNKIEKLEHTQGNLTLYAKWQVINYTITYVLDGGTNSIQNPASYTIEDEITLHSPTKEEYSFMGWYQNQQFTGSPVVSIPRQSIGAITLYARWEKAIATYEITYALDGGVNHPDNPQMYIQGQEIVIKDPTKDGYTFLGWFDVFGRQVVKIESSMALDILLTAKWQRIPQVFSITYHLDGGTNSIQNPASYTEVNEVIFLSPVKTGYQFKGWFMSADLKQEIKNTSGYYQDLTLYAKWEIINYTITYVLDGGINSIQNPASYTVEGEIILFNPTKSGYEFKGWYTDSGFINKIEEIKNASGDLTLYAKWEKIINSYAITYVLDGGANHPDNPSVCNQDETVVLKDPSKTGYQFKGWYTDNGFSNIITSIINPDSDLTLYAKWEKIINSYTITYVLDGGANHPDNPSVCNQEQTVVLKDPAKTGYQFMGWYTDTEFNNKIEKLEHTQGNLTLYAKWEKIINSYAITYVLDGGANHPDNPSVCNQDETVVLKDPSKTGYEFKGWYTDSGFNNIITSIINPDSDLTLYAKWEIINYTITYVLDGGTNSIQNPASYTIEDEITLFDPTKEGYEFKGWYTDNEFNNKIEKLEHTQGNITLYAKWEKVQTGGGEIQQQLLTEINAYLQTAEEAYLQIAEDMAAEIDCSVQYVAFISAYYNARFVKDKIIEVGGETVFAYLNGDEYNGQSLSLWYSVIEDRISSALKDFYAGSTQALEQFLRLCLKPATALLNSNLIDSGINEAMDAYVNLIKAERALIYGCRLYADVYLIDAVHTIYLNLISPAFVKDSYSEFVVQFLLSSEKYYAEYVRGERDTTFFADEFENCCMLYYEYGLNSAEKEFFNQTAAGPWYRLMLDIFNALG